MTDPATQLADEYHDRLMRFSPTEAQLLGDYRFADTFEDPSRAAEDEMITDSRGFARRAEELSTEGLDEQQRITRAMVGYVASSFADLLETRMAEFGTDPIFGTQVELEIITPMLSMPNETAAAAMFGKYAGVAAHFRALADRHRDGVANGRVPAEFAVRQTLEQLDSWLAGPVDEDRMLQTQSPPDGVDAEVWRRRLTEVVEQQVRPAVESYRDVLRDEVLPQARPDDKVGLTWLPGGDAVYATTLRYHTTTELTPQEIHDIGLGQIASLEKEYAALGPEVVGTSDVPAILEALRSDPALHHTDGQDLVDASVAAMGKAKAAMHDWFDILPKSDCDVQSTTSGAKAFYFPPATDGSRGGTFFINTSEPEAWGRYELEAMAYHEAIPGHHLQLAIASELTTIPEFRKHAIVNSYAEGWGLYTERLADEMGLYTTAIDRMGMLSADSMRACRLIVDTGMHALGWSRQQAVEYMTANSPLAAGHVVAEIDRYAVMPGQACSYMIGRLEIQRMRRTMEDTLGSGFDIKAFHNAVLDGGALPLALLDEVVQARLTTP